MSGFPFGKKRKRKTFDNIFDPGASLSHVIPKFSSYSLRRNGDPPSRLVICLPTHYHVYIYIIIGHTCTQISSVCYIHPTSLGCVALRWPHVTFLKQWDLNNHIIALLLSSINYICLPLSSFWKSYCENVVLCIWKGRFGDSVCRVPVTDFVHACLSLITPLNLNLYYYLLNNFLYGNSVTVTEFG